MITMRVIAGSCSLPLCLAIAGCSRAPEFSVYGSFFPVWILCTVGGLLLMAGVRGLIGRSSLAQHLTAPILLYLSLAVFFTCALWLVFFR